MRPTDLRPFLRAAGRVVAFGFALCFLSSFGQTFFIALSSPGIRSAFDLSNAGFGALYAGATLASGLTMIWAGGVLDRVSVRAYAAFGVAGLALAALSMSLVTHVVLLGLTLFCLRLFGQGMLAHAGITSAARLEGGLRGRATALVSFGLTFGEGLLPLAAVAVIAAFGWRELWQLAAGVLVLAFVAGAALRLGAPPTPSAAATTGSAYPASSDEADPPAPPPQSRWAIFTDPGFLLFLPAMAAPSALVTGFFFHQRVIAEASGWPLPLLAISISVFAVVAVVGSLSAGALVDRIGALAVSRVHLLPLAAGGLALAFLEGAYLAPLFFALIGLTAGAGHVVSAAVLAELFGTRQLGRVRALGTAVMVVASATTPALAGLVLDAGASLAMLGVPAAAWAVAASVLDTRLPRRARTMP